MIQHFGSTAGLPSVYYDPKTDLAALLAEVLGDPSLAAYGLNCGAENVEG